MNKSELENGMIVRNDIGVFGLYLKGVGIIWKHTDMGNDTEMDLHESYNEDLRYIDNVNFYIDKVYKYNNPLELQAFFDKRFNETDLILVWKREDEVKDEQRYIRIVKCDKDTYWYANKIGKVYKTDGIVDEFGDYIVLNKWKGIASVDCIEVSEIEYRESIKLNIGDKVKIKKGYIWEGQKGEIDIINTSDNTYRVKFFDEIGYYTREQLKKVK